VNFLVHLFPAQAGFMQGAGCNAVQITTNQRESGKHRKAFEGQEDFAAGALLDRVQNLEISFQQLLIDDIAGRGDQTKINRHAGPF